MEKIYKLLQMYKNGDIDLEQLLSKLEIRMK